MVLGSLVHGTGSSLACPDWPLCHGTVFPEMTHGVEFEHTHRLMALGVVVLVGTLLVRALRRTDRVAVRLAGLGCALVVVQATLGGLTVIFRLPPAISIAHLATSMTFLSVMVVLAVRLWPRALAPDVGVGTGFALAALLVFVQIVFGAVVRHTGAVLACAGFPLCTGEVWPDAALARLQVIHRTLGALALVVAVGVGVSAARRATTRNARIAALLPPVLAALQVTLGLAVVLTYAPLDLVTLHHLGGALLLASLVAAWALHLPTAAPAGNPLQAEVDRGVFEVASR